MVPLGVYWRVGVGVVEVSADMGLEDKSKMTMCMEMGISILQNFGNMILDWDVDGGSLEGPLMSYAANKIVQNYEYKLIVIDTLRLIKGNSQNNLTIHIKGAGAANETPEIITTK